MDMVTKKAAGLAWKFCECGCRGHVVKVGSLEYWAFFNLDGDGKFRLRAGHGWVNGRPITDLDSLEAADQAVREHAKLWLAQQRAILRPVEAALR